MNLNDKISLLLRHADRNEIPKGSFGNEILLNDKGKRKAQLFGEKLVNRKVNKIFTSPIERCVQTAQFIQKGYGNSIEIIKTNALGAPGLHIIDEKNAGNSFLQYSVDGIYKRFIQGIEIPGISNINELNSKVSHFINKNTIDKGTTIFITHDILIALYHFSINKTIYTKDNWVSYMTGLKFINGKIYER